MREIPPLKKCMIIIRKAVKPATPTAPLAVNMMLRCSYCNIKLYVADRLTKCSKKILSIIFGTNTAQKMMILTKGAKKILSFFSILFDSIFCCLYLNLSLAKGCDKQCMKQQRNRIGMFKSEKKCDKPWYIGAISMIWWSNINDILEQYKSALKKRTTARWTDWEKFPIILTS